MGYGTVFQVLQLNDSPETEVDPGDVRELVTYESQTTVCQNNLDTEGNENLKLKEQVADLEKK